MAITAEKIERTIRRLGITRDDLAALIGLHADDLDALCEGRATPPAKVLSTWWLLTGTRLHSARRALEALTAAPVEWRQIPGFSKYEASSGGEIRRRFGGPGTAPLRTLKQSMSGGRLRVTLYDDDGHMKTVEVHRAVCLAFHPRRPGAPYACHRDGRHLNNREGNLYWGTAVENAQDAVKHAAERIGGFGTHLTRAKRRDLIRRLHRAGKISRNKALALMEIRG